MRINKNSNWEVSCLGRPSVKGVYCICDRIDGKVKVYYIGSSSNIKNRLENKRHPYQKLLNKGIIPFVKYRRCENYKELEAKLISRINPELNVQHRSK